MAKLTETFQAIATDIKALITGQGTLTSLKTTTKLNLVAAINELFDSVSVTVGITGQEADQKIDAAIQAFKMQITGGAIAAELDTLSEIASKIQEIVTKDAVQDALLGTLNQLRLDVQALQTESAIDYLDVYTKGKQ